MASSFSSQVSAVQVGTFFVRQYYHVLQQQPDSAYQFYNDASTMMLVDGDSTETAVATLQIHNLILTLNFTGIEIKTAHFLNSWDGGVLAMVSGFVQSSDYHTRRKFVQTFFLAPQEKGYFVLNDIFHFLDEEQSFQPPPDILTHDSVENNLAPSNPVHEAVSEYLLGGEIENREYEDEVQEEGDNTIDGYNVTQPQQHESHYDSRADDPSVEEPVIVSYANTRSTRHETSTFIPEEHASEPTKHTYASILRAAKGQPGNSASYPAPSKKTLPVDSEWNQVSQPTQSYPSSSKGPEKFSSEAEDFVYPEEEVSESLSVYVGNLNSSVTESDLEHEFKKFGRIRPDGVAIRSRKESGAYYGFVEFEDLSGVQNALKASQILINGWEIYVEERRPNSGAYRGARRGRGRGDASRGRFGGRGYGRTGGYDNSEYSRPRGNEYYQRTPRQGN